MNGKHWLVVAGLLGAIGLQLSAAHTWSDVLTPATMGAIAVQIAATLGALFSDPPAKP